MKASLFTVLVFAALTVGLFGCTDEAASDDPSASDPTYNPELQACLADCDSDNSWSLICGDDGWLYDDACEMACYGVSEADDEWLCAATFDGTDCTSDRVNWLRYHIQPCGDLLRATCTGDGGYMTPDVACPPKDNPCFADCPPCPDDEAEFVCGDDGVRYCNACVMACMEATEASAESCTAFAAPAEFCDPQSDTIATRQWGEMGCNRCDCAASGLWHCSFWACP